jgi:hypothetical protein
MIQIDRGRVAEGERDGVAVDRRGRVEEDDAGDDAGEADP